MGNNNHEPKTVMDIAKKKAFEGAFVKLEDLQKQDGMIADALAGLSNQTMGVIQTLITAISPKDDDIEYRQILLRARWKDEEQRQRYVKALAVCRMVGAKKAAQTLLDLITAQSAGDGAELRHDAIEGITHTTFTTREEYAKRKKYEGSNKSNSPIS